MNIDFWNEVGNNFMESIVDQIVEHSEEIKKLSRPGGVTLVDDIKVSYEDLLRERLYKILKMD